MTDKTTDRPYRPLVYVASPLSGDVETNNERTRSFCRFVVEQGCIPLAPQLMYPQFMNDEDQAERELAMFMDVILLGKCSELWVLGDRVSSGMQVEIEVAKKRRQTIRWFNKDFQEVPAWEY